MNYRAMLINDILTWQKDDCYTYEQLMQATTSQLEKIHDGLWLSVRYEV